MQLMKRLERSILRHNNSTTWIKKTSLTPPLHAQICSVRKFGRNFAARSVIQMDQAMCSFSSGAPLQFVEKHRQLFEVSLPALVQKHLSTLSCDIRRVLEHRESEELQSISQYSFLKGGKLIRPTIVLLMSGCCSSLNEKTELISNEQKIMAIVSEMIHAASLVHDDVIDGANERRNQPTVNALAGNRAAILVGDFILAKATQLLASIGDPGIISLVAQVVEDLVKGEFMQMGSRDAEDERFTHYMLKTYKKTASLFAHSCKAVAQLAHGDEISAEMAFEYGKNLGLAFQLIDDTLDFSPDNMDVGKPTFFDLRLGLATAPVLFASRQHKQLNDLILRRFSKAGDVELAYQLILQSDGIMRSKQLAEQYCRSACANLSRFPDSEYKSALLAIAEAQCSRNR